MTLTLRYKATNQLRCGLSAIRITAAYGLVVTRATRTTSSVVWISTTSQFLNNRRGHNSRGARSGPADGCFVSATASARRCRSIPQQKYSQPFRILRFQHHGASNERVPGLGGDHIQGGASQSTNRIEASFPHSLTQISLRIWCGWGI